MSSAPGEGTDVPLETMEEESPAVAGLSADGGAGGAHREVALDAAGHLAGARRVAGEKRHCAEVRDEGWKPHG